MSKIYNWVSCRSCGKHIHGIDKVCIHWDAVQDPAWIKVLRVGLISLIILVVVMILIKLF